MPYRSVKILTDLTNSQNQREKYHFSIDKFLYTLYNNNSKEQPLFMDSRLNKVYLIVADHRLDSVGRVQYLKSCDTSRTVSLGNKSLSNDSHQNCGKLAN